MTVAVESSDKEVTFYRDLLGFEVGGMTLNSGATQQVLDKLFKDTCSITAIVHNGNDADLDTTAHRVAGRL